METLSIYILNSDAKLEMIAKITSSHFSIESCFRFVHQLKDFRRPQFLILHHFSSICRTELAILLVINHNQHHFPSCNLPLLLPSMATTVSHYIPNDLLYSEIFAHCQALHWSHPSPIDLAPFLPSTLASSWLHLPSAVASSRLAVEFQIARFQTSLLLFFSTFEKEWKSFF